ncbi:hypothetical protein ES332_D03G113500v1 [Gossypium tomentosum]|uniref:NADH-quinone oxidoreductase subunit D domain-containing protein n=1 Tax=Gossypium tomentosum TaxID=34277 RepID=A0A5D2LQ07_GOSTO|nr:hypothetical protein ES332_D03G113500v1 [Gossypium tomentosum]
MLELSHIVSRLLWLGPFMAEIGAQTSFFYIFRERELIYDLFEAAIDMRMMHNYFHISRVVVDLPYGWIDKCLDFCNYFLTERFIRPNATSIGIKWDLRKIDHFECYDEFNWKIQWQKERDSLSHYLVQISEMPESIKIIQQALEGISGGPYLFHHTAGLSSKGNITNKNGD